MALRAALYTLYRLVSCGALKRNMQPYAIYTLFVNQGGDSSGVVSSPAGDRFRIRGTLLFFLSWLAKK